MDCRILQRVCLVLGVGTDADMGCESLKRHNCDGAKTPKLQSCLDQVLLGKEGGWVESGRFNQKAASGAAHRARRTRLITLYFESLLPDKRRGQRWSGIGGMPQAQGTRDV